MDIKSLLGYSVGSPFAKNPYIDIDSNIIDMSSTLIDLWGIDKKTGRKVKMKAGARNPYIFEGNVREIPMQDGGSYEDSLAKYQSSARFRKAIDKYGKLKSPHSSKEFTKAEEANYGTPENHQIGSKIYGDTYGVGANPTTGYYVNEFKKPTGNQNPPIYTPYKNDPRLKMYNDSLLLHTLTKQDHEKMMSAKDYQEWQDYVPRFGSNDDSPAAAAFKRLAIANGDYPHPTDLKQRDFGNNNIAISNVWQKPVQPVLYKPAPARPKEQPVNTISTQQQPSGISGSSVDLTIKPTPFSFTYPTYQGSNSQKTSYFPSQEQLDNFTKENAVNVSSKYTNTSGTSTGNLKQFQMGGNPYQSALQFIFDDEDEGDDPAPTPQSEQDEPRVDQKNSQISQDNGNEDKELAMQQAMMSSNPYSSPVDDDDNYGDGLDLTDQSYTGQLQSGQFSQAGQRGRQIIGEISSSLGYTPQFNSILRTPAQQEKLINQGLGVKNSYHLSGDAVDMKPADWNRLPDEKKMHFRANYDVIYHNNHYHIEPKG